MNQLSLELTAGPLWMLLGIILVAVLFAVWTYQHTIPKTTRGRKNLLIVLRSLGLAALLFAIFEPIASSSSTQRVTPSMALVVDNSQSMLLPEVGHKLEPGAETRRDIMMKSIHAAFDQNLLADSRRLDAYTVGDRTLPFPNPSFIDSIRATSSATDLSSVFETIRDARKTKNTEAIVLYTDGAFTAGQNPIYTAEQLGVPVYVVGLGDSTEPRDAAVTELFTNEVATIGTPQPVDVTIHYGGVKPGEHLLLELFEENQKIGERPIEIKQSSGDEAVSFTYTPTSEGIKKLTTRISGLSGEATDKNNIRLAYVRVLKNKFHVVLFAGAPSPDVSFIQQFFSESPGLTLSTYIQKQGPNYFGPAPTRDSLKSVDLVVLVGFPVASTSDQSLSLVRDLLTRESRSLLFIPSRQVDYQKLTQLGDALPFQFDPRTVSANELKVALAVNPTQADAPVLHVPAEDKGKVTWEGLAPLFKTETHITARPESQTVAEASVQGVKLGEPLLITRHIGNARQVALTGYGLWQWKLTTFGREASYQAQSRVKDTGALDMSALDIFLSNSTRWLTTQEENKRVKIEPGRKFYEAGERIDLFGQVYDESYVPVERADVSVRISGGGLQKPLDIVLNASGNGRYAAAITNGLPKGDYTYSGIASLNGRQIGTDEGRFNVGDFNIEFAEPRMRSDILREVAARTGGKFYTPQTASTLLKDISASPRFAPKEITNTRDFEIWNSWPLLTLALLFFSAEWLIRKRTGML